ncbi:hypothetical protein MMC25_006997 [Agyrium rufum]|nr:hypothetical protein [Agyrium rufum]
MPESKSPLFLAEDYAKDGKKHLLLAASGSVATIKIPKIVEALSSIPNLSIRILITASAEKFLVGQSAEQPSLSSLSFTSNVDGLYRDEDEWKKPWVRGDPILHIELRNWADALVVAPLSANTLAKFVHGIADNLLTSVIRAWDTTGVVDRRESPKKIIVAPAMNTAMWLHPITAEQMLDLDSWRDENLDGRGWVEVLKPQEKELACGFRGDGAMMEWSEIVEVIKKHLKL